MKALVLVASMMLVGPVSVSAQPGPQMRGPAAERIEAFKKIRLMETLKLGEETSIRFFSRYNKHQEALKDIGKRRNGIIDRLQGMVKSNVSDAEIEKTIQELIASENDVVAARQQFFVELKEIFSAKQIAEYIVFERNFNQNLRELMKEISTEREERLQRRFGQ